MIIKILLIGAALGIAVFVVRQKAPGKGQAIRRVAGFLVVSAGIIAVLWPDLTTWVANLVGVDRGTDLVLYGLVVVFAYTSLTMAQRIHLLELDIRVLTRALALSQPARPPDNGVLTGFGAEPSPGSDRTPGSP